VNLALDNITIEQAFDLAVQAHKSGVSKRSEEICLEILKVRPDHLQTLYLVGSICLDTGDYNKAYGYFSNIIDVAPDIAHAYVYSGAALEKLSRNDEAIGKLKIALQINPNLHNAWFFLGNALLSIDLLNEAVECYQKAISLKENFPEAHYNLGLIFEILGQTEKSISGYQYVIQQKPDHIGALFNLHAAYYRDADLPKAMECLKKALKISPENKKIRFFVGMLHDYTGNTEVAFDQFNWLLNKKGEIYLQCWEYIKSLKPGLPRLFGYTSDGLFLGCQAASITGLNLEFGVRSGVSIRQIAAHIDQDIHGFDSFQGLPESWHELSVGEYTTQGVLPEIPDNVQLHVGLFEESLPAFLEKHSGPVRFMNVDCDLYSSTVTIFEILNERIVPGTVIIFDEYIANPHWQDDEFKAFQEAVETYGWRYDYLAISLYSKQAIVVIR
tara:strand:+ start:3375 stop:4700 length:1326 start_codon:yes stop_codon:yes gene_type:complete